MKREMQLKLTRLYKKDTYTIGKLYINNQYFCDTLEDKDRGLNSDMTEDQIFDRKVKGATCIPTGLYHLAYTYSPKYKRYLPLVLNVKGYAGIRIHSGNTDKDTEGCILLGENKKVGQVINSRKTCSEFNRIVEKTLDKGELITLKIE